MPPLALYLHLPWCVRKCPYCDFNSHAAGSSIPRDRYIRALCRDLDQERPRANRRALTSIFFGGGTPSLFTGAEIGTILEAVAARFTLADDVEITLEANPGSVERHNLSGYRSAGVNRLSLGAQSFAADMLRKLGRIHGPDDIHAAFHDARAAGFDNVNLDLMHALPGQDVACAIADVDAAIALNPEHLSCYQLTLEPNTVFYSRPPAGLPDEDASFAIQEAVQERLAAAGFARYEISAFAREGRRCRHNLNYWLYGDYLAAGAGAHGKITDTDGRIWRYRKPNQPRIYIEQMEQGGHSGTPTEVPATDLVFEFLLNALRLPAGFTEADFSERTGLAASALREALLPAAADGLLVAEDTGHWRASDLGLRFLNDLQARFLPATKAG